MADQADVSQGYMQVEYEGAPQAEVAQLFMQVEYETGTGAGAPTQEMLLRHGAYFNSSGKQRFWWAK